MRLEIKNRDVYLKEPTTQKLVNEGVANVNDDKTVEALKVLRYELETFVCDGQYEKGLAHILETYLKNIEQPNQPAVWISGFYGSGKSHLVKILRALWEDTVFDDGATARGICTIPKNIQDLLKELSTQAKRYGKAHSASGTLGSGSSSSVRLALLRIVFKSVGLPEQYSIARFVMWLKNEGIFDAVLNQVVQKGLSWEEELDNFYVAEGLHQALVTQKPNLFSTPEDCAKTLRQQYLNVQDISSDEMLSAMRQALNFDGKFPLTLIVLDEIQQHIGEDSQRSIEVQELVEACSKNMGGKLLFIGTGQTAVTGTSNLKKLEGRFTVRVELSDADVDTVIRKVILAKKPEAIQPIEQITQTNLGEISRHLEGTTIGHKPEDIKFFSQDYPILPVRRRFWESTLRVLDQTGTDSQLRNQLSMIHKVIQTNVDAPLGNVVAADYLYFDAADKLLQFRILPRKVHEKTMTWIEGSEDERLMARACGLVFLINKLAGSNKEIGIRSNVATIADLLIEDLSAGSSALRSKLPNLLDSSELLMKVGDEYRIQTEESTAWNDDFSSQRNELANTAHRVETERTDRIRQRYGEIVKKITLTQGTSKVAREISSVFNSELSSNKDREIIIWIRDGWNSEETSVIAEARQAGNESPTVFVFIPKRSADDLRHHLMEFKAAKATLDKRGVPNTPEGSEARSAMETTKQSAESKIRELLDESFSGARVFQGGGNEILGETLPAMLMEAANNALLRLYPQFSVADHAGWSKVYEKAQKGAPDALKAVGDEGEPVNNPVCKNIQNSIAGGKKGTDIRSHFEGSPFGWSRDAVDGGLQVLLVAGVVLALNEQGQKVDPIELDRKTIGRTLFKVESASVTAIQRMKIKKLFHEIGLSIKQGEESGSVPEFLVKLKDLADRAGGEAPKPLSPDTASLDKIRLVSGNEQLITLFDRYDELIQCIGTWNILATKIEQKWSDWTTLKSLMNQAQGLVGAEDISAQVKYIEGERQLLAEPDLIGPSVNSLTQLLRGELNRLNTEYQSLYQQGLDRLGGDVNWQQLDSEQQSQLISEQSLSEESRPRINVQGTKDVLNTLDSVSLSSFRDRVAAIPGRFDKLVNEAAKRLEPATQFVDLPRRTLKTEAEIEQWVADVQEKLISALAKGPVSIQ